MNKRLVIFIVFLILINYIFFSDKYENMTPDEAVQNVASLYNTNMATVSKINVTSDATIVGVLQVKNRDILAEIDAIKTRLNTIDQRLASTDQRLASTDQKFIDTATNINTKKITFPNFYLTEKGGGGHFTINRKGDNNSIFIARNDAVIFANKLNPVPVGWGGDTTGDK